MRIAVIGSGISGLGAAYFLSKKHKVDIFEKENHFGGHSYTVEIPTSNSNNLIPIVLSRTCCIDHFPGVFISIKLYHRCQIIQYLKFLHLHN